jgi:hypothetical protein
MDDTVEIYSVGIVYMSVCASRLVPREEVERRANAQHPTGISSLWKISKNPTFADGAPMPHDCNVTTGRVHYLLSC